MAFKESFTSNLGRIKFFSFGCNVFREAQVFTLMKIGVKVYEKRVLRNIFGPMREEVIGEWRRLPNKELYDLYSSPNIIRVTKSKRM